MTLPPLGAATAVPARREESTMSTPHDRGILELPTNYHRHLTVDFKKDRKFSVALQAIFLAVILIAVAVALIFDLPLASGWNPVVTTLVTLLLLLVYMAVHEATHGVALRVLTGTQPSYAVRFPFLSTSSPLYLTRGSVVIVALAPCLIWGDGTVCRPAPGSRRSAPDGLHSPGPEFRWLRRRLPRNRPGAAPTTAGAPTG